MIRLKSVVSVISIFFLITLLSESSFAQCISPAGIEGDVIFSEDFRVPQACLNGSWYALAETKTSPSGSGCIFPLGNSGEIIYNNAFHVPQFCDGENWIAIAPVPGSGGLGCVSPPSPEGAWLHNSECKTIQYCDGANWVGLGRVVDSVPDSFSFSDQTDVALTTQATSNILQILGTDCGVKVTISGTGSPEYRICGDATCSTEILTWGNAEASINNTEYLQLRLVSNASNGATNSAIVTVGDGAAQWNVTTESLTDTTPDAFSFTDQSNVTTSTLIVSNSINITGIDTPTSVSVVGDGSPEFSINGGTWSTSGMITNGQTLQLRLTSAATNSTLYSATVTVGTENDQWNVSTIGDTTPDSFSFTDQTGVSISTLTTSNTLTITGIDTPTNVTISGDGSPQFRIGFGSWVTSATITNGQTLRVRLTSSNSFSTMNSATITVGTFSDQWDVTTAAQDTTPSAFNFTDQTDVATANLITSNIVQITGITGNVPVLISGDGSPEFRVCSTSTCSSVITNWTSGPATIQNNQRLQLRLTSSASTNTLTSATVTVGTGSNQWDVTTAPDTTPDAFSFTDQTDVAFSTLITSNSINITGIDTATNISISGDGSPQFSINGGAWTTSGIITNGQSLQLRLTSAANTNVTYSAAVTVGTESDQWDVTTEVVPEIVVGSTGLFTGGDLQTGITINAPAGVNVGDYILYMIYTPSPAIVTATRVWPSTTAGQPFALVEYTGTNSNFQFTRHNSDAYAYATLILRNMSFVKSSPSTTSYNYIPDGGPANGVMSTSSINVSQNDNIILPLYGLHTASSVAFSPPPSGMDQVLTYQPSGGNWMRLFASSQTVSAGDTGTIDVPYSSLPSNWYIIYRSVTLEFEPVN